MAKGSRYSNAPWILFIFTPFGAAIAALKNFREAWAKNIFWAFVVFYGITFAIADEEKKSSSSTSSDINRYHGQLIQLHQLDLSAADIYRMYEENESSDVLSLTIAIILSRFTEKLQALTTVYAFIYGFFLSRNLWIVLDHTNGKLIPTVRILLFALFLILPFWSINGFRFWTASQVYIYGVFHYLYRNKKIGLLIAAAAIYIHFAFLVAIIPLLIFLLPAKRITILFSIYVTSLFYSQLDIKTFNDFLEKNTSEKIQARTATYRDESRVELYRKDELNYYDKNRNWYAKIYWDVLIGVLKVALIWVFLLFRKGFKPNKLFTDFFSFILIFFSLANLMSSLPSGTRWSVVACFFTIAFLIEFRQNFPYFQLKTNTLMTLALPLILFFMVISIRTGFFSMSINTLIGNVVSLFILDFNISLNDIIKS